MVLIGGATSVNIIINAVDNYSKTFNKATSSMQRLKKVGVGLAIVGAGIAFGLAKAVKTSIDFESAFTGVRKTVELSEKGFADLEQNFKDLSSTMPLTFAELSSIGEIAGQLGVSGVNNLTKFTKTIADISATTNLTAEAAATDFARIANVMQEPLENVDRMGAVVVDLGNNFATTESEISLFAQRIAGAGKIAGFSTDEIFSISAALSSVGVQAEAGGSAMQKALLTITKSVTTSDDKLQLFAKTAGMTSVEFQDLWKEDASKAFEKFVLGLGEQGNNAITTLKDVGLGGIRTTRAFLSLANAGDLITQTLKTGSKAWKENTALTEEAEKRYGTLQSKLDILKNKFTIMGDEIGDVLAPIIENNLIPSIDNLIEKWKELEPEQKETIVKTTLMGTGFLILTGIIMVAVATFSLLALVITLAVIAIAGVIALILRIKNNWNAIMIGFQKSMTKFKNNTVIILQEVKKMWIRVFGGIQNFISKTWEKILIISASGINILIRGINFLIRAFNKLPGFNIGEVGEIKLSNLKKELVDIDALMSKVDRETQSLIASNNLELQETIRPRIERGIEERAAAINVTIEGDVFTQDGTEFTNKIVNIIQDDVLNKINI